MQQPEEERKWEIGKRKKKNPLIIWEKLSSVHHCPTSLSNRYIAEEELWTHVQNWVSTKLIQSFSKSLWCFFGKGQWQVAVVSPRVCTAFWDRGFSWQDRLPTASTLLDCTMGKNSLTSPCFQLLVNVSLLDQVVGEEKQLNIILQSACFPLRPQLSWCMFPVWCWSPTAEFPFGHKVRTVLSQSVLALRMLPFSQGSSMGLTIQAWDAAPGRWTRLTFLLRLDWWIDGDEVICGAVLEMPSLFCLLCSCVCICSMRLTLICVVFMQFEWWSKRSTWKNSWSGSNS